MKIILEDLSMQIWLQLQHNDVSNIFYFKIPEPSVVNKWLFC